MKTVITLQLVISLFTVLFLSCINVSEPSAPPTTQSGEVTSIQDMSTSRASHTATILLDGKVLIAGGFNASGIALASTELYDPVSHSFTPIGSMNVPRLSHTATLLSNGKVLITGGYNGTYLSTAEMYDPSTGTFNIIGQMTMPRSDHVAVLLNNNKVLIVGGVSTGWTFLATAELFDLNNNTFTTTGNMTTARESHTITLLNNGKVLITGGHKDRRSAITIYSSSELYEPITGTFSATGNMTIRRHKHDATLLSDGKVLISGGSDERDDQGTYNSTEIYNIETGIFTTAANMNAARYKFNGTSVLLNNGQVLFMGGSGVTELYNPGTNTFNTVTNGLGVTRLFATTTLLKSGEVLLSGGYGTNIGASSKAWIYSP
ncbi:MAG TPA: kelch repeat-containing protein [Ignavibacteriaceae bacterium]|nr:kelch repeat-containing protein [Ignavibacteriaceae bacterium]